jgi:hypothetical protein
MKLCFVSENGARETYFVDAARINTLSVYISIVTFNPTLILRYSTMA